MDRECLKVVLESVVDDMNLLIKDAFNIEGPFIHKESGTRNAYKAKIVFYLVPIVAAAQNIPKKDLKIMELDYKFDLDTLHDDAIFESVAASLLQARVKVQEMILHSIKEVTAAFTSGEEEETLIKESPEEAIKKQKDYCR